MSTLQDFIENRRREIDAALAPLISQREALRSEISALLAELEELDRAGSAIGMVNGLPTESPSVEKPTIKEAVVAVLRERPGGLVALDILKEINGRFNLGIQRTSLSPQLSRLKKDGVINRRGVVWFYVDKKRTSEANETQLAQLVASTITAKPLMAVSPHLLDSVAALRPNVPASTLKVNLPSTVTLADMFKPRK